MTDTRIAEIRARTGAAKAHLSNHCARNWEAHYARDMTDLLTHLAVVTTERDRLKKEMDWLPARGLPQKDGRYLVVCKYPCICYYSNDREKINKYEMAGAGAGFYDISGEWGYYPIEDVSYWMEIPKLPVEEEGEQK